MDSSKEIKLGNDVRDKLMLGINKLASVVLTTMGPSGSTVIIADEYGDPYITKDGVSVSNYIKLEDPVENIAATLLKQVAQNTVEQAGDGTTTSICLAQSLITEGYKLLGKGESYNDLKVELEKLEEYTVNNLACASKELKNKNIVDVATISSNNDGVIGDIIQKAYNHSTIVKVQEGNSNLDELTLINGMELDTSYIDNAFINKPHQQAVEHTEPLVMLVDGKLESLDNIKRVILEVKSRPIVIIADHFGEQVLKLLKENYNKGALNVVLVKSPGFANHRKNLMDDIADYTGATVLNPSTTYTNINVLGTLDSIYITKHTCTLLNEGNLLASNEKLANLKSTLAISTDSNDIVLLQQRITNLTGKVAIIRVGGNSEVEMKERKDRIEDAVLAVQCGLEEGIIEGGGVALYKIANTSKNKFKDCLRDPLYTILENGAVIDFETSMFKQNIIDPLKVTRCALQNAISVSKTILSTKAIVLNERLWK